MNGATGFNLVERDGQSPRRPTGPVSVFTPTGEPQTPRSRSSNTALNSSATADPPAFSRLSPVSSTAERSPLEALQSPQSPAWSSAVGRATTGKSGRVIERLQAENDRLKRELKLEGFRREDEQKKGEVARSKMESLQATNDNLVQMREAEMFSNARRERKMEEMRQDLEGERARRQEADGQLRAVIKEGEKIERELRTRARDDAERAKKANTHYDVLSSSWKQLDEGYRRKMDRLKRELIQLRKEEADNRVILERLEITIEQQRQETEKLTLAKEAVVRQFDDYQRETEESTRSIRETARSNEAANGKALADTLEVLGQMRRVMNLQALREERGATE